jgi:amidase
LLNVLAARDPLDPATQHLQRPGDYTTGLDKDGLKGARIGVPSDADDPLNDFYMGKLPARSKAVMAKAIEVLQDAGATIVRASVPTAGWIGGPGTTMAVLNRNPLSKRKGEPAPLPIVFLYELKHDLNLYLRDYLGNWAAGSKIKTMADIIAFNQANADKALRFGQDLFLAAQDTRGDLTELEYRSARAMDLQSAKERGLDAYMTRHKLDAVVFSGTSGASIAAKAGYPSVQVPAGFIGGPMDATGGKETPDFPLGLTFAGRAWSEAKLLRLAYAYEQATNARRPPPGLPAL